MDFGEVDEVEFWVYAGARGRTLKTSELSVELISEVCK